MAPNLYWIVIFCRRTELMSQGQSKSQSSETGEVCHEAVRTGSWGTQTLRACPASPARACVGMTYIRIAHKYRMLTWPTRLEGIQLQRSPNTCWKLLKGPYWVSGRHGGDGDLDKVLWCRWPQVSTVRLWDLGERTSFVSYCLFKARTQAFSNLRALGEPSGISLLFTNIVHHLLWFTAVTYCICLSENPTNSRSFM